MINKLTLLSLLLLICSTTCFSQSNFKEGYLIHAQGDTIRGMIDDRGDFRNSQRITFKESAASPQKEFLPSEVTSYHVGQKVYHSRIINYEEKPTPVLLELINGGAVKLFYWVDQRDQMRYFAQKDTVMYELTNDIKQVQQNGKTYTFDSKAYIGILNSLTSDCGTAAGEELKFNLKAISNYLSKYDQCKGGTAYVSEKPKTKSTITKQVFAGVNQSQVTTGGLTAFDETGTRTGLSAGMGLNINFPNDKLFLEILAEYNRKGAEAEEKKINFDLHYLNLSPGLTYVYPKGKFRPMLGAGFVAGYLLNSKSAYTRDRNGESIRIFVDAHDNNEVKYEVGYEARTGFKYELSPDMLLLLRLKYTKTLIPFNFNNGYYKNQVVSLQFGVEF